MESDVWGRLELSIGHTFAECAHPLGFHPMWLYILSSVFLKLVITLELCVRVCFCVRVNLCLSACECV